MTDLGLFIILFVMCMVPITVVWGVWLENKVERLEKRVKDLEALK